MNNKEYEYISSRQNDKIKVFSKLTDQKYRREYGMFLAEGIKLSAEALSAGIAKYVLVSEESCDSGEIKKLLDKSGDGVIKYILASPVFEKVSTERAPQGVIAVCTIPDTVKRGGVSPEELDGKRVIALDGIRDPGNLGTILRTALAFGFDRVLLHSCADVCSEKTVRASMGAIFRITTVDCPDLSSFLSSLKERGRRVMGAALTDRAADLTKLSFDKSDVFVIGNEGHGISDEVLAVCTEHVRIPMNELSESLNAAVAASVIMWEYSKL